MQRQNKFLCKVLMNNLVLVCGYLKLAIQNSRNSKGHWVNACYIFQKTKQKSSVSPRLRCDFCWMVCSDIKYVLLSFPLQLEFPFTHPSWKHYPFNHWVCAKAVKKRKHKVLDVWNRCAKFFPVTFCVSIFITLSILLYPYVIKINDTEAASVSLRLYKEIW